MPLLYVLEIHTCNNLGSHWSFNEHNVCEGKTQGRERERDLKGGVGGEDNIVYYRSNVVIFPVFQHL